MCWSTADWGNLITMKKITYVGPITSGVTIFDKKTGRIIEVAHEETIELSDDLAQSLLEQPSNWTTTPVQVVTKKEIR